MAVRFPFQFSKAHAAFLYLANRGLPDFTKGKACKLLFLADKYHLVRHARPVTGDRYAALSHGPVPSRIKSILDEVEKGNISNPETAEMASTIELDRRFEYPHLNATKAADLDELSETDIDALDAVIRDFGARTFTELRSLTHEMPAYERAWSSKTKPNHAWMRFEDFFREDECSLAGAQKEMLENDALRKAFPDPAWL